MPILGLCSTDFCALVPRAYSPAPPSAAPNIQPDQDANRAYYGLPVTVQAVLTGKVAALRSAEGFLAAVRGAKAQAKTKS